MPTSNSSVNVGSLPDGILAEAPIDGTPYARKNGSWSRVIEFPEAPEDGNPYARQNQNWVALTFIEEAPQDDDNYVRRNGEWEPLDVDTGGVGGGISEGGFEDDDVDNYHEFTVESGGDFETLQDALDYLASHPFGTESGTWVCLYGNWNSGVNHVAPANITYIGDILYYLEFWNFDFRTNNSELYFTNCNVYMEDCLFGHGKIIGEARAHVIFGWWNNNEYLQPTSNTVGLQTIQYDDSYFMFNDSPRLLNSDLEFGSVFICNNTIDYNYVGVDIESGSRYSCLFEMQMNNGATVSVNDASRFHVNALVNYDSFAGGDYMVNCFGGSECSVNAQFDSYATGKANLTLNTRNTADGGAVVWGT